MVGLWLYIILHSVFVIAPFFSYKIRNTILKFVTPVFALFTFIVIPEVIFSYTASFSFTAVGMLVSVELGLIIAEQVFFIAFIDHDFKLHRKEIREFVVAILVLLIFSMPYYMPEVLFGHPFKSSEILDFGQFHRIYLYFLFTYLVVIPIILRGKDREYCRMTLLFITFVGMINYALGNTFVTFIKPFEWPLHICNAAMYILPIALATKSEKVFYFTFFINVLGALFAALMPDYNGGGHFLGSTATIFWWNHIEACAMPLICVLTHTFDRPTKKQFFWSMVGFFGYCVFV